MGKASRLLFFRGVRRYLVKMICDGKHRRKHQSGEETEIEKQGYYGKSHIRRGLTGVEAVIGNESVVPKCKNV